MLVQCPICKGTFDDNASYVTHLEHAHGLEDDPRTTRPDREWNPDFPAAFDRADEMYQAAYDGMKPRKKTHGVAVLTTFLRDPAINDAVRQAAEDNEMVTLDAFGYRGGQILVQDFFGQKTETGLLVAMLLAKRDEGHLLASLITGAMQEQGVLKYD